LSDLVKGKGEDELGVKKLDRAMTLCRENLAVPRANLSIACRTIQLPGRAPTHADPLAATKSE
jgi:hypothetical protein